MKTGLIMEGGAMRGLFTAGVIDVLMENGIEFDGAIGVSAGAVFGCNYKSRQAGRVIRYNIANAKNPKYCSFRSLLTTGNLFGVDYCYHELPEKLDLFDNATYENNPMEFHVVATDLETGKAVYRRCDEINDVTMDWLRASASLPLFATIVEVEGYKLLDGGIADSVPIQYFESIGYNRNVLILTQPMDYVKKPAELLIPMKLAYRKYPNLNQAMKIRHIEYNETKEYIRQREKSGDVLVICPEKTLPIGRIEHRAERMNATYELGRDMAERRLDAIKEFLNK